MSPSCMSCDRQPAEFRVPSYGDREVKETDMPRSSGQPPVVVVLGASGCIGSVFTAALARRRVRLRAVSRRPPPALGIATVELYTADLTDPEQLRSAVDGADVVVHCLAAAGAQGDDKADDCWVGLNAATMAGLLDAVASRPASSRPVTVIYAGSITQVGVPPRTLLDGTEADLPVTAFERDKQAGESALLRASAEGQIEGISVRLPTVFGHSPV
ncbi:MAG TPA: NAD-dependent epimerase/dehydratase family protein, partial [Micromonosporaceae bacterium]